MLLQLDAGDEVGVRVQLWDIAGQDRFQKLTRAYFSKSRGVVIVCDVSREGTVDAVKNWKKEIDFWTGQDEEGGDPENKIPVILFANKADLLENAHDAFQTGATMERMCREQGILFWWTTSARTGENVNDGFQALLKNIVKRNVDIDKETEVATDAFRLKVSDLQSKSSSITNFC